MYIIIEVDNTNMIVSREFSLFSEEGLENFMAQTNIELKKEWFREERFTEHLMDQLEDCSNEYFSYKAIPITIH